MRKSFIFKKDGKILRLQCMLRVILQQTVRTCFRENLRGYICGRATYSKDWLSHNHGKTKVSQLQPTDASSNTLYLRENKKSTGRVRQRGGVEVIFINFRCLLEPLHCFHTDMMKHLMLLTEVTSRTINYSLR